MKYIKYFEELDNLQLPEKFMTDCAPFLNKMKECEPALYYRGVNNNFMNMHPEIFVKDKIANAFRVKMNKSGRKPVDTPLSAHMSFNEVFNKKFGWNVRNGIFTYRNVDLTGNYGFCYIFVPIGDFDFCWSPHFMDFYSDLEDELKTIYSDYDEYLDTQNILWEDEYGPDSGEGTWYYDGVDTGESHYRLAYEKINKEENEPDEGEFEWVPSMSFDSYTMSERQFEEEKKKNIEEIVNKYDDKNLCAKHNHEVSFNCDEYYLLNFEYRNKLTKIIWGDEVI